MSLVEDPTLTTAETLLSDNSDFSAWNAPIACEYNCYEIEADAHQIYYNGPKIMTQTTNCPLPFVLLTKLVLYAVKDFLTQANVSMIKRSALPKALLLKHTKLMRILAGCLKTQEVITMGDLRLPKFNKNRRINQQQVFVFYNDNVKCNIIMGTNVLSKTGIKLNYSGGNMD